MAEKAKKNISRKAKGPKRGEKEILPRAKNSRHKSPLLSQETKRWIILIGLSVVISTLLFPSVFSRPKVFKIGDVADRDIKAHREFLIENKKLTELEREEAIKGVLSVYDFDPNPANVVARVKEAFEEGREYFSESLSVDLSKEKTELAEEKAAEDRMMSFDTFKSQFFKVLDIAPDEKSIDTLMKNEFPVGSEQSIIRFVSQFLKNGIVGNRMMLMTHGGKGITLHNILTGKEMEVTELSRFPDLKGARELLEEKGVSLSDPDVSPDSKKAILYIASALLKPNLTFNKRETELRKDEARKSVKPFYFKVKRGEMIVREGERISQEHLLKLSELDQSIEWKEMVGRAGAMAILIGFLLSSVYLTGLMTSRPVKSEIKHLLFSALTLLTIFLIVMAYNLVSEDIARGFAYFSPRALLFTIPVACGAMLIAIFQGMKAAVSFSLIVSVLGTVVVGGQIEFFIYFFISSLVAAHGVQNGRERGILIKTGLKVSLINIVMALSIEALHGSLYSMEAAIATVSAFFGGILTGIVATGILPLIEMTFGFTTDIKLLELASLDQPLLRDLMVQSPGTYHHSVIVSNLVEATAKSIKANPLLAKVAAYYHDIGKMKKPLYFIENQTDDVNKHEKLAPSMSSLILISHVKDGVELAKEHKLGSEIIDIIRQHHGTSLISYFYQKAKERAVKKSQKSVDVKEEGFRYPGPKPQTKEAGLVMLADVVQAASKTLTEPTAARIQGMVQKIINKVFSDGQLNECELTLKDLNEIAKSFNKTLSGIFHHRIEYPESVAKNGSAKKGVNGNSDQLSSSGSRAEKQGDRTEAEESLKRLGLS